MMLPGPGGVEKFLQVILGEASVAFVAFAGDCRILACNDAFLRLFGYAKDDLPELRWPFSFVARPGGGKIAATLGGLHCGGSPVRYEDVRVRKDGSQVPVEIYVHKMCDASDGFLFYYAFVSDISSRRKTEEALSRSEEKYRAVFDSASDGIAIQNSETGGILEVNRAMGGMYGYTLEEFLHLDPRQLFAEDGDHMLEAAREKIRLAASGQPQLFDWHARHRDGHAFWVQVSLKRVRIDGEYQLLAVARDITERKQFEQKLQESRAELARAQREAHLGSWRWEIRQNVLRLSDEGYRLLGLEPGETQLNLEKFLEFVHPDCRGSTLQAISATLEKGAQFNIEHRVIRRDGSVRWIHCEGSVELREGVPTGMAGTMYDITRRRNMEDALRERERALEEAKAQVELFLDLMSHDINNLNQIALGYLEIGLERLKAGELIGPGDVLLLDKPRETLENSSSLIENVKKLQRARAGGLANRPVDIGEELCWLRDRVHAPGRQIILDCQPEKGLLVLANELIRDLFSNIVTNAVKHSEPDRPLHIGITVDRMFEAGQEYYKVSVEDNGPGIPDETKMRIFDRIQYGKKRPGSGGLGLYLVSTLAAEFHGRIWVEDRVAGDYKKGSRFVVMLPALRAESAGAGGEARA